MALPNISSNSSATSGAQGTIGPSYTGGGVVLNYGAPAAQAVQQAATWVYVAAFAVGAAIAFMLWRLLRK